MGDSDVLNTEMKNLLDVLVKELCNINENRLSIQTAVKRIGDLREIPLPSKEGNPQPTKPIETHLEKINDAIERAQSLNSEFNFILVNLNRMV